MTLLPWVPVGIVLISFILANLALSCLARRASRRADDPTEGRWASAIAAQRRLWQHLDERDHEESAS
jgi:hypothetical protein